MKANCLQGRILRRGLSIYIVVIIILACFIGLIVLANSFSKKGTLHFTIPPGYEQIGSITHKELKGDTNLKLGIDGGKGIILVGDEGLYDETFKLKKPFLKKGLGFRCIKKNGEIWRFLPEKAGLNIFPPKGDSFKVLSNEDLSKCSLFAFDFDENNILFASSNVIYSFRLKSGQVAKPTVYKNENSNFFRLAVGIYSLKKSLLVAFYDKLIFIDYEGAVVKEILLPEDLGAFGSALALKNGSLALALSHREHAKSRIYRIRPEAELSKWISPLELPAVWDRGYTSHAPEMIQIDESTIVGLFSQTMEGGGSSLVLRFSL